MDLYTKDGRPLQVSGEIVYSGSGTMMGRIKGEKVFGPDGRYVGTIVGEPRLPLHTQRKRQLAICGGKPGRVGESQSGGVSHLGRRAENPGLIETVI
jgi:hypothetical protein